MTSEIVRTDLRIPRELHEWIRKQSVAHMRSWNTEAVWKLHQMMASERQLELQHEQAEQRDQAVRP
jgi:Arc-like DNA binding domain